jgi:hypothetical protein
MSSLLYSRLILILRHVPAFLILLLHVPRSGSKLANLAREIEISSSELRFLRRNHRGVVARQWASAAAGRRLAPCGGPSFGMVGSLPPARPLARGECGACTGCWARMHLRAPPLRGAGLPGLDQLENRRRGRLQRQYHPHASQPAGELGGRLTTCQSLRRRIRGAGRTSGAAVSTSRSRTPLHPTFSSARSTRCLMVPGWQYRHVCSAGGKRYAPRRAASTSARSQSRAVGHSDVLRFADD